MRQPAIVPAVQAGTGGAQEENIGDYNFVDEPLLL